MLDLLLTGGQVVTGSASFKGDVGIKDGKIALISGTGIQDVKVQAREKMDATGKIVVPGAIDSHVHYATALSLCTDDAQTTSTCAAFGGVTTFLAHFPASRVKETLVEADVSHRVPDTAGLNVGEFFATLSAQQQRSSVVDFGIHWLMMQDEALIRQMPDALKAGVSSFKMIPGYHPRRGWFFDDTGMMTVMENVVKYGGLALLHCENGYIIGYLEDKFAAESIYSAETFLKARPNIAEAEAVNRIACLAKITGCPIYIVHLSTKEGLENVVRAKAAGVKITVETCPQYLLLNNDDLLKQGALMKFAPPARTPADNEALWEGIQQGFIDVIASDNAPWDKRKHKLEAPTFQAAAFGIPGIETILPLIYSEGVAKGKITLSQMVRVLCENPAKTFGLYPKKGVISLGADADLVIIDPEIEWQIRAKDLHTKAGYTPYEGWPMKGKPVMVLLRGELLVKDGQLYQKPGFGRYISRPVS